MKKRSFILVGLFLFFLTVSNNVYSANYPTRDVNLRVPYNPGGSTDLTARALGESMGKILGTTFMVTNTPGAGGALGSTAVKNAPKDGYNILANGMLAFASMAVLDTLETTTDEWDFWLATFTPNVVAVRKDSPYETMDDLINALKENPGKITVGTAGPGSGGHIGMEVLRSPLGISYIHVPYQGGNPAIIATLGGEVEFTTQLLVEMEDMIKAGDLRALACLTPEDIEIKDGPVIPSILKFIPELASKLPMGETTGITVPKGLPDNVLKTLDAAFDTAVKSEEFISFTEQKGFMIVGINRGEESAKYMENLASIVSWTLHEAGVTKKSPEEFNIKKPE